MEIFIGVINRVELIDCHCHVTADKNLDKNISNLEYCMKKNNVSKSILFIDPFTREFNCKNSSIKQFHYCHVTDKNENTISIMCDCCKKTIYKGDDPFYTYNKLLFDNVSNDKFYLFLMLSISNLTMNKNIKYFEDLYGNKLRGLKLYTGLSDLTLNEVEKLDSDLPLLIHTGKTYNQNPTNMIKFLKKYKGNIILAHYGRYSPEIVDIVRNSDNIYVDTSPTSYIYNIYLTQENKRGLFDYEKINCAEDMYYKALELYGIDKMIFGSDYPFSKMEDEISVLNSVNLTKNEYNKITNKNIIKVLGRK